MFVTKNERPKTRLRVATLDRLMEAEGLTTENARARALGVDHASLWRVRRGMQGVTEHFISATVAWARGLNRDPQLTFEDLFEVSDEPAA